MWISTGLKACEKLRNSLTIVPVVEIPRINEHFKLFTDASGIGVGAMLTQGVKQLFTPQEL